MALNGETRDGETQNGGTLRSTPIASDFVTVDGLRLHYRSASPVGAAVAEAPVLMLHGWPTSSFLWRHAVEAVGAHRRAIALDLPGFGRSQKGLDLSYSFRFYERVLDGFVDALGIESTGLAVHDVGGPLGLYWACQRPEMVRDLAILNTLVYPEMSWAVVAFVLACKLPLVRSFMSSRRGIRFAMRLGVRDRDRLTEEILAAYCEPFADTESRRSLLKAGTRLHPGGFATIAKRLPTLSCPVRVIYGKDDPILPDIGKTVARLARDLPQAEVTALDGCGHFLQEDRPELVAQLLADFFGGVAARREEEAS